MSAAPAAFQAVMIHHTVPEHAAAFAAFARRVIEGTRDAEGLLEFSSWLEPGGERLVAISRWRSPEDFQAAMPLVLQFSSDRRPEWTSREDELILTGPA